MADPEPLNEIKQEFKLDVELTFASQEPGPEEDAPAERIVVTISFCEAKVGFGEMTLIKTPEGTFLDTEYMGRENAKKYFLALLDKAILDTNKDKEKHLLYNKAMGRHCGEHCILCHPPKEE